MYATCELLSTEGVRITRPPGPHETRQAEHCVRRGPERLQDRASRTAFDRVRASAALGRAALKKANRGPDVHRPSRRCAGATSAAQHVMPAARDGCASCMPRDAPRTRKRPQSGEENHRGQDRTSDHRTTTDRGLHRQAHLRRTETGIGRGRRQAHHRCLQSGRTQSTQGRAYAGDPGETSLAGFHALFPQWTADGALEVEIHEETDTVVRYDVVRCRYAEMYREMGLADIGHLLSCGRDGTFCSGLRRADPAHPHSDHHAGLEPMRLQLPLGRGRGTGVASTRARSSGPVRPPKRRRVRRPFSPPSQRGRSLKPRRGTDDGVALPHTPGPPSFSAGTRR